MSITRRTKRRMNGLKMDEKRRTENEEVKEKKEICKKEES